jgi:hypothetical protein
MHHSFNILNDGEEGHGSMNLGIELGYLAPDQRPGLPGELLSNLVDPEIDEDTEAAAALRANANVKVRKVGKVARSLNAQSVRKLAKRVTLRGQNGYRRGKPPRIPPGMTSSNANANVNVNVNANANVDADANQAMMYALAEEDDESDDHEYEREEGSSASGESMAHDAHADGYDSAPVAENQSHSRPPASSNKDDYALAPTKQVRIKEEGSGLSPSHDADPSKAKKDYRHSSILEEAKDIPAEVVAATLEAGRKRKSRIALYLGAVPFRVIYYFLSLFFSVKCKC